jgi:hypothetical protein
MTARELLIAREARQDREADELAERTRRDAPLRKAEAELLATQRELLKFERQKLTGVVTDPYTASRIKSGQEYLDPDINIQVQYPEYAGLETDAEYVRDFNAECIRVYRENHPDVYWSETLQDAVGGYFDRNHFTLTTTDMISNVVDRFQNAGLLPERPAPVPEPEPIRPRKVQATKPEVFTGRDLMTGEAKSFTAYEVHRMDSETYRRTFRPPTVVLARSNW